MTEPERKADQPQGPDSFRRKTLLIDRDYQMGEVSRGVSMFVILIFAQVVLFVLIGILLKTNTLDDVSSTIAVVAVSFTIPIALCVAYSIATVQRTHRVAGAAYRLTEDVPHMLANPSFRFHLRRDDYLQGLAEELNRVMEALQARQQSMDEARKACDRLRTRLPHVIGDLSPTEADALTEAVETLCNRLGMRPDHPPATAEESTAAPSPADAETVTSA